ncbi:MAG: transporter substrate-binding protein [Nitrospinota bacterium]
MVKKLIVVVVFFVLIFWGARTWRITELPVIKVGILHSLTGSMAVSEKAVVKALLFAIEEINEKGGLLGRKIEPIVRDGKSDWSVFKREAEKLLGEEKVAVVFGCWTSACRKTVKPLFEEHDNILVYPVQYEGLEESSNIVYLGAAPNQQIIPAVKWSFDNLGKSFFLVGSDYVFPRTANAIIKDQVEALGGKVVGEEYVLLTGKDFYSVVQKISNSKPQVILNTVNGDGNFTFFKTLAAKPDLKNIPVMSFSVGENEIHEYVKNMTGSRKGDAPISSGQFFPENHYAAWNYFQSLENPKNRAFIRGMKKKYGKDIVTSDPMVSAYAGVHIWARAVKDAGTDNSQDVRRAIKHQNFDSPGGFFYVDPESNHTWKTVYIGKLNPGEQFSIVWASGVPVSPTPYPVYRTKRVWKEFLEDLFSSWGEKWANPGIPMRVLRLKKKASEKLLKSLASHPEILLAVEQSNKKNRDIDQDKVTRLDRIWREKSYTSDFNPTLFQTSSAGKAVSEFMNAHSEFSEILVTDRHGLNVAISNRTTDFFQGDEEWWQQTFFSGKGRFHSTDIEYDKSAQIWGMGLCLPVYTPKKEVIGVMKAFMSIKSLVGIRPNEF